MDTPAFALRDLQAPRTGQPASSCLIDHAGEDPSPCKPRAEASCFIQLDSDGPHMAPGLHPAAHRNCFAAAAIGRNETQLAPWGRGAAAGSSGEWRIVLRTPGSVRGKRSINQISRNVVLGASARIQQFGVSEAIDGQEMSIGQLARHALGA
jgi:hypothetical protein